MRSSAVFSGKARATFARTPVGSLARSFQMKPACFADSRGPSRIAFSISGSMSARLVLTSMPTGEITITSVPAGSAATMRPRAWSIRCVDLVEGAFEDRRGGVVEAVGIELGQVPELVPGDVRGAEREPHQVVVVLAQVELGRVGDPGRCAQEASAQTEHLLDGVAAEHLVDGLGLPEQPLEPVVLGLRRPPALQHDPVVELPTTDEGAGRDVGRGAALVRIDRERAGAVAGRGAPRSGGGAGRSPMYRTR